VSRSASKSKSRSRSRDLKKSRKESAKERSRRSRTPKSRSRSLKSRSRSRRNDRGRGHEKYRRRSRSRSHRRRSPSPRSSRRRYRREPSPRHPVHFDRRRDYSEENRQVRGRKVFVGNLKWSVTGKELRRKFEHIGEIEDVYLPRDKGFGFVTFHSKSDGEAAIREMHRTTFKDKALIVEFAQPRRF